MFAELFAVVQPKDPKVAIGLSFLAHGKGSPLYDPVALLATLKALSSSASASAASLVPTGPTVAEAQAMLDSASSGILAPTTKAALVISTDVSLRSADGTADTDDRIMLVLLCYFLAVLASAENVHSVTIALSARKKGSNNNRDATTPADAVQFMIGRIAFFGAGSAITDGLEPPTPSFASFGIHGVEVRVFQLQAQTTPSPEEKLEPAGLVAQHKQIAELREANAPMFAFLEAALHEAPIFFTGCGPIGVDLALFLAEHARGGYTISFGSGVNGGDGEKLKDQVTHCGGPVLLTSAAIVDIGPSITRALVTPPGIVMLDDAKGAAASASNTFKVAGSPMIVSANGASADSQRATGLGLRIFGSNLTSFLGREALGFLVAQCTDPAFPVVQFPYSHSLALTMGTGLLTAHGAVIDLATLADPASTASTASNFAALSAMAMPPSLAATIKANITGITTVAGLYKLIALGMDARLGAIMAEWHSISSSSSGLKGLAAIPAPVVSTAAPIITPAGLALGQPF